MKREYVQKRKETKLVEKTDIKQQNKIVNSTKNNTSMKFLGLFVLS